MATVIVIDPDGTAKHLVDPVSERIAAAIGPKVSTQRSSHVESWHDLSGKARNHVLSHEDRLASISDDRLYDSFVDGPDGVIEASRDITNFFWADMLPVNGPVLGPFKTRQEALDAETTWLKAHGIPLAGEHTRKAEIDVNRDPGTQHD